MPTPDQEFSIVKALASRKFIIIVGLLLIDAVALFAKVMPVELWADTSLWLAGLYITGNVVYSIGSGVYQGMLVQAQATAQAQTNLLLARQETK